MKLESLHRNPNQTARKDKPMTIKWNDIKNVPGKEQTFWLIELNVWNGELRIFVDRHHQVTPFLDLKDRSFSFEGRNGTTRVRAKLDAVNINWNSKTVIADFIMSR